MFQIYTLLILLQTVFTQAIYNCEEAAGTYKRGDSMIICVFYLNDATPSTPYRMVYQVTVDKFTALLAPGAYTALSQIGSTSLNVNAQLFTPTNTTKYITSSGAFPMNSIVIRMSKGVVNEVFWDNVCFNVGSCESSAPDGSSVQGLNNDLVQCSTPSDCDPKVYVSFVGSDSSGQYMTSSGMRMSQFQAYNTAQIYSTAQNAFSQVTQ